MAFKKYSNFFFMITSFIDHIIYLYSRSAEVGSEMIRFIIRKNFISPPFFIDIMLWTLTFSGYLVFVYHWQI